MYDYGILRFQDWEFSQGAYNAIGICSALHNIIGTKDVRYMLALKTGRSHKAGLVAVYGGDKANQA